MSENTEPDLSDVDVDILLITDYFGGELHPAEAADVEARVVQDDEFFAKVGRLIEATLLLSSVPHRGMRIALAERQARLAEDLLAARVVRSLRPDIDRLLAEPEPAVAPAKPEGGRRPSGVSRSRPHADGNALPPMERYVRAFWRGAEHLLVAAMILALILSLPVIPPAFRLRFLFERYEDGEQTFPMLTKTLYYGVVVNVHPDSGPRVIDLPAGARATVMPGSRLAFDTLRYLDPDVRVLLDGEASFEVPNRSNSLGVHTSAGVVILDAGEFALRTTGRHSETLITVSRGRALATPLHPPLGGLLEVTSGFVRMTRREKPTIVTEGTGKFPRVRTAAESLHVR